MYFEPFKKVIQRFLYVDQNKMITFLKDIGEAIQNLIADHGVHNWVATFNDDPWIPEF